MQPLASLPAAATDHEKNLIERQVKAADQQIDALVYDLYGLTEDEIRIVEGGENRFRLLSARTSRHH